MALNRITTDSIADNTVIAQDIVDGTVTLAKLASGILPSAIANSAASYANGAFTQANTDVTNISISSATYGNAAYYPIITVSANGRINTVSTQVVTGVDAHPFFFTAMGS
jgi:hypothetical protein